MQRVVLGTWGSVDLYDLNEAGVEGNPSLPQWLPDGPYRAARLHVVTRSGARTADMIAVWPEGAAIPPLDPGAPLAREQIAAILLTEATERWQCRVCGGLVNVLYPDFGIPSNRPDPRHPRATHCPYCGAHVDTARLHATVLIPAAQRTT